MLSTDDLFNCRRFNLRWYLRFKLSFRNLVEMMAESRVSLAHTTIEKNGAEFWNALLAA
jgi:transposase-like protein